VNWDWSLKTGQVDGGRRVGGGEREEELVAEALAASSGGQPDYCHYQNAVAPGHCVVAAAWVGSNGPGNDPELGVGKTLGGDWSVGHVTWDANLANGFDSGWVNVQLTLEAGGGANNVRWTASPGGVAVQLPYSGVTYGAITKVQVRASASGPNRRMSWASLQVRFLRAGTEVDSIAIPAECWPVASTFGGGPGASDQRIIQITPALNSDPDKVIVSGSVRLESQATTLPGPDAVNGQIYVYADNCAPRAATLIATGTPDTTTAQPDATQTSV